jgi:broad specificity phosphatase PhoE
MSATPDPHLHHATEIWLIRHGESTGNRDGIMQGQEDLPLSDLGHEQARKLAARLARQRFAALYASDLARAVQTAAHLDEVLRLGIRSDRRLREIDVGRWSGLTNEQIAERFPREWHAWQERDPTLRRGGGESYAEAQGRIVATITAIARRHAGERIAMVCHGGVMRAYLGELLGLDLRNIWHLTIGNTAICRLRPFAPATGGKQPRLGRIDGINDLAHLEIPIAPPPPKRGSTGTTKRMRKATASV